MSNTTEYEVLVPGGHQRLVDNVLGLMSQKPDATAAAPDITAGAALGITGDGPTESDAWLQRTSTSDGPTTIRSIHGNTIVQDGELLPVNMTGIETTGFNQWDEVWENGRWDTSTGAAVNAPTRIRSKNPIHVFPNTGYYLNFGNYSIGSHGVDICFYDANMNFVSGQRKWSAALNTPANAYYMNFSPQPEYGTVYKGTICINLSDPARNGTYEPHWQQERTIPAGTLRGAGSVFDELTETERITRVGVVDLGTLNWTYNAAKAVFYVNYTQAARTGNLTCSKYDTSTVSRVEDMPDKTIWNVGYAFTANNIVVKDSAYTDAASFKAAVSGVMLHYALATPTTVEIDPPLNMTYRTAAGGTERVMVPTGELSAPPTIVTAQGYTAESLRDAALATIAPVENGLASTNYGIGSYLVHGGQLCKVTTAIATGEAIAIGTNVTATTVMAEVIALTQ